MQHFNHNLSTIEIGKIKCNVQQYTLTLSKVESKLGKILGNVQHVNLNSSKIENGNILLDLLSD